MSRLFLSLIAAALLACPMADRVVGGGPPIDPTALGQQVQAKAADGQIVVSRSLSQMVYETQLRTETRTKVVEVDGEKREETEAVEAPVTIAKTVPIQMQQKIALEGAQVYDMQGKRVEGDQLADALKEEQTVLLATRKVPRYYLTVYKPDTLLLVIVPPQGYAPPQGGVVPLPVPTPIEIRKPDAPRTLPAPAVPVPGEAPPKLEVPKADAPKVLPAPAAPRTLPAPAAPAPPGDPPARVVPGEPIALAKERAPLATVAGLEPQVSMARIVDDKFGLRRYVKDVSSETAMREVDIKGVKEWQPVQIEVETILDVERRYPQKMLKIYRADKKPLAEDELAKLKETERCVLVSTDGKEVDARYLKIVKPEALIVVAPATPGQSQLAPAIGLPANIGAPRPLPAPATVPMPPDP